jgi:hypothetical protein
MGRGCALTRGRYRRLVMPRVRHGETATWRTGGLVITSGQVQKATAGSLDGTSKTVKKPVPPAAVASHSRPSSLPEHTTYSPGRRHEPLLISYAPGRCSRRPPGEGGDLVGYRLLVPGFGLGKAR